MKTNTKILFIICLVLCLALINVDFLMAQLPPPELPGSPPKSPIDGGLLGLSVVGAMYFLRKLKARGEK